jgi:hypothetical protein
LKPLVVVMLAASPALAQVEIIPAAADKLFDRGVLGIFCAILLGALVLRERQLAKMHDARDARLVHLEAKLDENEQRFVDATIQTTAVIAKNNDALKVGEAKLEALIESAQRRARREPPGGL